MSSLYHHLTVTMIVLLLSLAITTGSNKPLLVAAAETTPLDVENQMSIVSVVADNTNPKPGDVVTVTVSYELTSEDYC